MWPDILGGTPVMYVKVFKVGKCVVKGFVGFMVVVVICAKSWIKAETKNVFFFSRDFHEIFVSISSR